uniref:Capsid protein n=1 Tax=uncultured marine virus TaxID=186617 RepID=S4TE34_9VIRU|nr:hypothetical protein [uncultured marine virus]
MVKSKDKRFQRRVKDIVRDELREELEEKTAVIGANSELILTSAIPNGNVSASTNLWPLFPVITQGAGQYNRRTGNEISLKSMNLKGLINFQDGDGGSGNTNYRNNTLGIRVMILRQKDMNSYTNTIADFQGNKLLENGEISTPGPAAFSGTTFNLLQKINRDQFSVRYDKVLYLRRSREYNSGASQLQYNVGPHPVSFEKTLTFGKNGLKLTYGKGTDGDSTNFPYVLVVGIASTIDGTPPDGGLVEISYTSSCKYTDA